MFIQIKLLLLSIFVAVAFCYDWKAFKSIHNLAFSSVTEEVKRLAIFTQKMDEITNHNLKAIFDKSISYTLGANEFTHLTYAEIVARSTGFSKDQKGRAFEAAAAVKTTTKRVLEASGCTCTCPTTPPQVKVQTTKASAPASVDWRGTALVGPIKDQGICGWVIINMKIFLTRVRIFKIDRDF
jgi:hypothetical protein